MWLANEVAVVTGGAAGIGAAIAERFQAEGARVWILDRDAPAAEATAARLGCQFLIADVTRADEVARAFDVVKAEAGGISLLVNNAAAPGALVRLHEYSVEDIDGVLASNLSSYLYCTHAVLPQMLRAGRGAIVNIGSESALKPPVGESVYGAGKAGVVALTHSVAVEYGPAIRCNCISPGVVRTPMTQFLVDTPGLLDPVRAENPGWEPGEVADIAALALFLACNESRYVNGQNIVADGGTGLHHAGWTPVNGMIRRMFEKG
jgi:NAD(P)-dependent dehydrogenase (short-subunit alcohol dehydrogenase family)